MMSTEWSGPENMFAEPRTGQVLATEAPAPRGRLAVGDTAEASRFRATGCAVEATLRRWCTIGSGAAS